MLKSAPLTVLKGMNKLKGVLCISGLRHIVDVELCRNANLASKPNLYELILNFQFQEDCGKQKFFWEEALHLHLTDHSRNNAKSENDEKIHNVVLESLQPHGNLTKLAILNYGGRNFPSWLLNPLLPKLTAVTLNFCTEPNYLPPFGKLPYLRFLKIFGSTGDRNVGDELSTYSLLAEYGSSKQPREPSYPSLEELSLRNMLNLVEWQANDGDFPCLKKLVLKNCPELWKIPTIPQNIRDVFFEDCPKLKSLTCPSVIRKLTILWCGFREIMLHSVCDYLKISNCVELISITWMDIGLNSEGCPKLEPLPVKDVLHSTNRVHIYDCPRLYLGERYVYQGDTMLKELNLSGNNEIRLSDSTIPLPEHQFKLFLRKEDFREVKSLTCAPLFGVSCQLVILNLASLETLEIMRCTKVISVTGLDSLSNLKRLSISYCPKLCTWNDKALPLSLKFLELNYCDKLRSLPLLSVHNHSSTLKVLVIKKCPRLTMLEGFQKKNE